MVGLMVPSAWLAWSGSVWFDWVGFCLVGLGVDELKLAWFGLAEFG